MKYIGLKYRFMALCRRNIFEVSLVEFKENLNLELFKIEANFVLFVVFIYC